MHPDLGKGAGQRPQHTPKPLLQSRCHPPVARRSLLRRGATAEIQYGSCRPWESCMPWACRASASGFFFVSPHRATDLPGRGVRGPCGHSLPAPRTTPAPCSPIISARHHVLLVDELDTVDGAPAKGKGNSRQFRVCFGILFGRQGLTRASASSGCWQVPGDACTHTALPQPYPQPPLLPQTYWWP